MAITLYIESISIDSVSLRWLDSVTPSSAHDIYRSEDGVDYDLIDEADAGDVEYSDSGLESETRYWYKVVIGATESDAKSVVTQACWTPSIANEMAMALPTADGEVTDQQFNDAMRRLESIIRQQSASHECVACSVNGAIVLVCSEGCRDFIVDVTEDINSISIIGCEDAGPGSIDFRIPADETWRVCGFPVDFGFSGGECFDAPLSGGSDGRSVRVYWFGGGPTTGSTGSAARGAGSGVRAQTPSGSGSGTGGASGGGGAGGGPLTVRCRTEGDAENDDCSLDCGGDDFLRLRVSGGRPPYTITSNVVGAVTAKEGTGNYSVTPPPNTGSGVAGNAYRTGFWQRCSDGLNQMQSATYGCDDQVLSACASSASNDFKYKVSTCQFCGVGGSSGCPPDSPISDVNNNNTSHPCTGTPCPEGAPTVCDMRTAPMIAANCNPCGATMAVGGTKTVTVTDADGVSVVKIMNL